MREAFLPGPRSNATHLAAGAAAGGGAAPAVGAQRVAQLGGRGARRRDDVVPPVSHRQLRALDEHGVVAPHVAVRAAVGMRQLPVQLDAHPEPDDDAVRPDPPPVDHLPHLPARARQPVRALDVPVVAVLQRRLDAGVRVAEHVDDERPVPLPRSGAELHEDALRQRTGAHGLAQHADGRVLVGGVLHEVEERRVRDHAPERTGRVRHAPAAPHVEARLRAYRATGGHAHDDDRPRRPDVAVDEAGGTVRQRRARARSEQSRPRLLAPRRRPGLQHDDAAERPLPVAGAHAAAHHGGTDTAARQLPRRRDAVLPQDQRTYLGREPTRPGQPATARRPCAARSALHTATLPDRSPLRAPQQPTVDKPRKA